MDAKIDLILIEISKLDKKIDYRFDEAKNDLNDFKDEMYAFRKDVYRFMHKTNHNFEDMAETNRYTGNYLQGYEKRIVALENSR